MDGAAIMIHGILPTMVTVDITEATILTGDGADIMEGTTPIMVDRTGPDIATVIITATGTTDTTVIGTFSTEGWTADTLTAIPGPPMWSMEAPKDPLPMIPGTAQGLEQSAAPPESHVRPPAGMLPQASRAQPQTGIPRMQRAVTLR